MAYSHTYSIYTYSMIDFFSWGVLFYRNFSVKSPTHKYSIVKNVFNIALNRYNVPCFQQWAFTSSLQTWPFKIIYHSILWIYSVLSMPFEWKYTLVAYLLYSSYFVNALLWTLEISWTLSFWEIAKIKISDITCSYFGNKKIAPAKKVS
jgi:hypothetical protein